MQRNAKECAHCGKTFVRLTGDTPLVNRSDGETFHVSLYAGPNLSSGRTICTFGYVHDRIKAETEYVNVAIPFPTKSRPRAAKELEEVADKVADLVQTGKKLASSYVLEKGRLVPGFLK